MEVVDIYCRVSTTEQAQEGYSLEAQEEKLRKYADAHSWTINAVLVDGGYSGASMDRPALTKVIDDAKNHRINKVLVYKLDRLSRSQKDTLYIIEDILLKNKVDFVSMTETLDTSTPFGMAMIGILSVFAQLERETIKERMMLGKNASVQSGRFHGAGGSAPIGYKKVNKKLVPDEYESMIVREVFSRFIAGESFHQMMNEFEQEHPIRGCKWSVQRIKNIIDNPIYIGKQNWHGNIVSCDDIEPIVEESAWNEARQLREIRSKKSNQPQTVYKHKSMLGGMIFCGQCGKRMRVNHITGSKGKEYYYYEDDHSMEIHTAGYKGKITHRFKRDYIDSLVIEEIRKLSTDRKIITDQSNETQLQIKRIEQIEKRIAEIKTSQSRLIDLYTSGIIDKETIQSKTAPLSDELAKLEHDLQTIVIDDTSKTEAIESNLDTFESIIDTITDNMQLYNIVHALIKTVTINENSISIQWNF